MDELRPIGPVDVITDADLRALAVHSGPCVSAFLPTRRHGPETQQGKVHLRHVIEEATEQLLDAGFAPGDAQELLAPMAALLDDEPFWQHQGDGLALFAASDRMVWLRLAATFDEEVVAGAAFRLRRLLPLLEAGALFDILALSGNQVRLHRAGRTAMGELDLGGTPTSMAEALRFEDPERQLQVRSAGGRDARFHGHGAGDEIDKAALERYFRAVDRGLCEVVGAHPPPLVLACVGYYAPIYRAVSDHPAILEGVVEGAPERVPPDELHERALAVVAPQLVAAAEAAVDRFRAAAGTGRTATAVEEVVTAAAAGAVEVLLVDDDTPAAWGVVGPEPTTVSVHDRRQGSDTDLVDLAVRDAVRHGAEVHVVDGLGTDTGVAAILRW